MRNARPPGLGTIAAAAATFGGPPASLRAPPPQSYPAAGLCMRVHAAAAASHGSVSGGRRRAKKKSSGRRPAPRRRRARPRRGPARGALSATCWRPAAAAVTRPSPLHVDYASIEAFHLPPPSGHPSMSRPRPRSSTGAQMDGPTPHCPQVPTLRWGPKGPVSTDKSRQHGLTLNSS